MIDVEIEKLFEACQPERGTLITLGVFDGVHLGHQHLIGYLKRQALVRDLLSVVITFSSHPLSVVAPQTRLPHLMDLEERQEHLKKLGLDMVIVIPFTRKLSQLSADEFVDILVKRLKMRGLVIGPDFALGRDRRGDVFYLHNLGKSNDFTVDVVQPLTLNGDVVSSTAIRQALSTGDIEKANCYLGYPFRLGGQIVSGSGRGRLIGFPTANIEVAADRAVPANGVYVTRAYVGQQVFDSVTNIGNRPTFDNGLRSIEVHLLNFRGQLHGKRMDIEILKRLRGERKFSSPDELKKQIEKDIAQAGKVLGE